MSAKSIQYLNKVMLLLTLELDLGYCSASVASAVELDKFSIIHATDPQVQGKQVLPTLSDSKLTYQPQTI